MDYVSIGKGKKTLVVIPGLGDSLKTVKGTSFLLWLKFFVFVKDYRILIFSRKNHIEEGYSIKDMAADQAKVMKTLGINKAYLMGISQGGMISQQLTLDYPELVEKLVLCITLCKPNEVMIPVITNWIRLAKNNDYKSLFIDIAEKTYKVRHVKSYKPFYPIFALLGKPENLERFTIQAKACLKHNTYDELYKIKCPTLVIGGGSDKIVGGNSSTEIASRIPNSKLKVYESYGHGANEEVIDFYPYILRFLNSSEN